MDKDLRIVRVPLPVGLIRQMDQLVLSGIGGFGSRHEFIREAIEAMALELTHELAKDDIHPESIGIAPLRREFPSPSPGKDETVRRQHAPTIGSASKSTSESTALAAPSRAYLVDRGIASVEDQPLFGMHNRDYPTLWAASFLAAETASRPCPLDEFFRRVTRAAWEFGQELRELENNTSMKLSALFPTNPEKRQAAEAAFRAFAIGSYSEKDSAHIAVGPFFIWKLAQLSTSDGFPAIALTPIGFELLEQLHGLSLELPHSQTHARTFLDHLMKHAPSDWSGFRVLLEATASGAAREEVIRSFRSRYPEWRDTEASTNTAGYVSRAREWGILKLKQIKGRYELTDFGNELLNDQTEVNS